MDRNKSDKYLSREKITVALLAEGVDRNSQVCKHRIVIAESPSSRRAWIEIPSRMCRGQSWAVALLAEGVDRNVHVDVRSNERYRSPSSRRAWIEIMHLVRLTAATEVALLAEGVDRNLG